MFSLWSFSVVTARPCPSAPEPVCAFFVFVCIQEKLSVSEQEVQEMIRWRTGKIEEVKRSATEMEVKQHTQTHKPAVQQNL